MYDLSADCDRRNLFNVLEQIAIVSSSGGALEGRLQDNEVSAAARL